MPEFLAPKIALAELGVKLATDAPLQNLDFFDPTTWRPSARGQREHERNLAASKKLAGLEVIKTDIQNEKTDSVIRLLIEDLVSHLWTKDPKEFNDQYREGRSETIWKAEITNLRALLKEIGREISDAQLNEMVKERHERHTFFPPRIPGLS